MDPEVPLTLLLVAFLCVLAAWQRKVSDEAHERIAGEIQDAKERGTNRAIAQHPQIDSAACIGCGSCVKACPEADVLALVHGVAHVVHGARCIGHGRCAVACPVAALTVGLGDAAARPDIPVLSDSLETSVGGIYIAGELGGFALIKNAIEQGSRVIEEVARQRRRGQVSTPRARRGEVLDVLIVGAGPAGLAASLKAKECGLSSRTIDQEEAGGTVRKYPRRKLTMTQPVDLPLHGRMKKREYVKEELVELWDGIIRRFDLQVSERTQLLGARREGGVFVVETTAGSLKTDAIVLALGRRGTPRRLGVPGEDAEKVLYQLIDAATYRQHHLLVVGGGDSAIEAAIGLANQVANTVTLSYRKENFFRLKPRNEERILDYEAKGRVRVAFSSNVRRVEAESVDLELADGRVETLRNDFAFVFAGGEPPYPLLRQIGIQFGGNRSEDRRVEIADVSAAKA